MIETDVDYAVQLLEEAGWKDSDGDGVREKDGLKRRSNLMYFAGFHAAGGSHVGGRPRQGKTLGIAVTVEGVSANDTVARMFSGADDRGLGLRQSHDLVYALSQQQRGKDRFLQPGIFLPAGRWTDTLDRAMNSKSMEESLEWWKKAQWDGTTGTSYERGSALGLLCQHVPPVLRERRAGISAGRGIRRPMEAWPLVAAPGRVDLDGMIWWRAEAASVFPFHGKDEGEKMSGKRI